MLATPTLELPLRLRRPTGPRTLTATLLAVLAVHVSPAAADPSTGSTAPEPGPGTQQVDPPQVTIAYEAIAAGDVATDLDAFAADARAILRDARGLTLGGSLAFAPVSSDGEVTLVLASPEVVEDAAPVCSRHYSCHVDDQVYINDDNWRQATPAWNATGAPLWAYRQYLINHEVGHYLGLDHASCPGEGEPAPVMQQQSISLEECAPNGWPLERERETLARTYDVPVYPWVFPDVLATYAHRDAVHALAERGIVEGRDDGYFRPTRDVTRAQVASFVARTLDLEAEGEPPFEDVGAHGAHAEAIAAVSEAGIVEGYEDGTFRPLRATSRAQMASILTRAYDLDADGEPPFDDVPPHHPHAHGVAAVADASVAEGYDDGRFRPALSVTRGQMSSFLARADDQS